MKKLIFLGSLLLSHFSFASDDSCLKEPMKVLIVGAGPSGLSAAKALQNRGIYPDIIEKEDQIRTDGAGIAIPANGSWALNKLGIDISAKALLIRSMQVMDDQGEILTQVNLDTIHPEGAQFYSLGREELIQQLLSSLYKTTQIQTSTTIKHFSEENDRVKVEFSNGQVKSYDLVIGCDGVHSSLRRSIHPNEAPEYLGILVWRSIIDAELIDIPTYMLGSDRLVMLYPMANNKTYLYGHVFQPEKCLAYDTYLTAFSSFGGLLPGVLHEIDQKNFTSNEVRFYIHHIEKSHSVRFRLDGFSRVVLIGDAAHAFGPTLQNGAAQSFEDAYVLQELFADQIANAEQIPSLLDTFEKRRMPRVQTIFTMSNAKIQAISNPELIRGRNEAIRKTGAPNVHGFKLIMQYNP